MHNVHLLLIVVWSMGLEWNQIEIPFPKKPVVWTAGPLVPNVLLYRSTCVLHYLPVQPKKECEEGTQECARGCQS